jgi:lambda family phage portal protein
MMKDLEGTTVGAQTAPNMGTVASPVGGGLGMTAGLYENLETYPGQVFVTPSLMDPNTELAASRLQAVRAARQVERISAHMRSGLNKKTNMVVGATLRVSSTPDWRSLGMERDAGVKWARDWGRQAEGLFHSWAYDRRMLCDGEGHYTFGGLMWMAFRNLVGPDGEFATVIQYDRRRAERYRTRFATFINVIDPQRITTPADRAMDPNVYDGRLLDPNGRMIGFWAENRRSEQRITDPRDTHAFVPREVAAGPRGAYSRPMGIHWFQKHRGAAQRGITQMVNTLKRQTMLDRFDGAQLGAAIVGAAMATYVKTAKSAEAVANDLAPGAPRNGEAQSVLSKPDYYKRLNLRIGGNQIPVLDIEDEIQIAAANAATIDAKTFRNGYLREFANALEMDFEQFAGDYSETNYSSARSALVNIWRGVISERNMFTAAGPSVVFDAFVEECIVMGWLPTLTGDVRHFYENRELYTRCTWTGPAMGWVDPKKEAEAAAVRTDPARPLSTLAIEAATQGQTIDELIEARAEEQDLMVEAGLIPPTWNQPAPPPGSAPGGNDDPAEEDEPERREERN